MSQLNAAGRRVERAGRRSAVVFRAMWIELAFSGSCVRSSNLVVMLVVTTNDLPGWEIQRVIGEVFGLTVRSRNIGSQIGAGLKSLVGGELQGMTKNLTESRNEAMSRLVAEAAQRGGNVIVAMRFETSDLGGNWSEICAYGTAAYAVPVTDAARQTAAELGYGPR